ncbi:acyl-CoA dehydrogenase [Nocardioides sp. AE5]|uniref:acyl-CoA dehydrogenase family protein n=1 Tax=Nocardioides sp. AE5 TaxID=2962573 RepID=UPI002881C56C|nr:acyl-CoA dehydrogenase [Nocardioides sp. AE5]MDT0200588.1 acyl-CoA dehydrogenase [Nocardioides sp. AE5]
MATETFPETESTEPDESAADDGYVQPEVDVAALAQLLDGDYAEVRDLVRRNLVENADVLTDAETMGHEEFRDRVRDVVVAVAQTGQTALGFPAAQGGKESTGGAVAAFETMAFGDLSVLIKMGVQFGLFGGAIQNLGNEEHHAKYLPDVISGKLLGCFAMTEAGHGSNVQALETVATYDAQAQEFVINTPTDSAHKDYIGNAGRHGEMAVVFAQLVIDGKSEGVHAFVVPIRIDGEPAPGVRIADSGLKMGLNGVDNGRLWFDDVRVPRTALLNRFADVSPEGVYSSSIESPGRRFFTMLGTLVLGRVCVGAAGTSAAKVALAIAIKYADRRRQFESGDGQPEQLLLDYGQHQRRLLPLLAKTYALHFAQEVLTSRTQEAFWGDVDEATTRALESRAAGTKAMATWHATSTIQECREACGGAGYMSRNRFTALKADTDVFTTFEGDNTVMMQLVAKGLLTGYASDFSDMDQFGMVKFVAGLAVETVVERTNVHKLLERVRDLLPGGDEWDQEAGLLDPNFQEAMFRFREEHLVSGAARRLKRGVDLGMEPGEVFSRVQDHVIAIGHAHVERLVLDAFVEKVAEMPDSDNKVALGLLVDLYALSTIEANSAWYMEHGRLTTQRSKAITREINDLCRKIRPLAVDLVDAFGIPAEMMRADELLTWGTDA